MDYFCTLLIDCTFIPNITDSESMSICYKRKNSVIKILSYESFWLLHVYNYNMQNCLFDMLHNLIFNGLCNIILQSTCNNLSLFKIISY